MTKVVRWIPLILVTVVLGAITLKSNSHWVERVFQNQVETTAAVQESAVEKTRISALKAEKAARKAEASAEATWEVAYEKAYADLEQDFTPFTDLVQTSIKGVVHLQCPQWQGSGFVICPNMIVTARHCVEDVEDFLITTHNDCQIRATRAISDKEHDVAFIRIDNLECVNEKIDHRIKHGGEHIVELMPLELASIKDCVLGQPVYVIGSPYGKVNFNNLTTGIISGVNRDWSSLGEYYGWEVAFTIDSAGHPGNSGGPVFTMSGDVVGILVGGFSPVLISVMPVDLFINNISTIEQMFIQDKYGFEKVNSHRDPYYNHVEGNEYY